MNDDDRNVEALRQLRESCAWMVGVQTAILGFLITLLQAGKLAYGSAFIKGATVAFGISIICASLLLGAIPWVLDRKPLPAPLYRAPIVRWPVLRWISLGAVGGLLVLGFVTGIGSLMVAVVTGRVG